MTTVPIPGLPANSIEAHPVALLMTNIALGCWPDSYDLIWANAGIEKSAVTEHREEALLLIAAFEGVDMEQVA